MNELVKFFNSVARKVIEEVLEGNVYQVTEDKITDYETGHSQDALYVSLKRKDDNDHYMFYGNGIEYVLRGGKYNPTLSFDKNGLTKSTQEFIQRAKETMSHVTETLEKHFGSKFTVALSDVNYMGLLVKKDGSVGKYYVKKEYDKFTVAGMNFSFK